MNNLLTLLVALTLLALAVLPLNLEAQWTEEQKILAQLPGYPPSGGTAGDNFGYSVSISGTTALAGAHLDNDNGSQSGSAYILEKSGGIWSLSAKLKPSDGNVGDQFGQSVSISGTMVLVGARYDDDNGAKSGSAYIFEKSGGIWSEIAKLIPMDGAADDWFGQSVSISGNTVLVGANRNDDNGDESGSAYIFEKSGGIWTQSAKIKPSDGVSGDQFGYSVSISDSTALVGAYGDDDNGSRSGSAYIFEKNGGTWSQSAKLIALDGAEEDFFGWSVSISDSSALVGAYGDNIDGINLGSAYIFENSVGVWSQSAKLIASDGAANDYFGFAVSISDSTALVGAPYVDDNGSNSGSAYIFEKSGGIWSESAKLNASDGFSGDLFGWSVSISDSTTHVGAHRDDDNGFSSGSAYMFEKSGGTWSESAKLKPSDGAAYDQFGRSVSISGNTALVGAPYVDDNGSNSGSAYIFEKSGGIWIPSAKLTASDGAPEEWFGYSVSISGVTALVGARRDDDNGTASGSAYIFEKIGGIWSQSVKLIPSDGAEGDEFGHSVSVSGNIALVGADRNDDNGNNSGSTYIFEKSEGIWSQSAKLTASDGAAGDFFGRSVAISGNIALVGASQDDDNGNSSGSAYIFEKSGGAWPQSVKLTPTDAAEADQFGYSVSISGTMALMGAHQDDDNGNNSGSAYVFEKNGGTWSQSAKLNPLDGAAQDWFGYSVSISGNMALVGAHRDDDNGSNSGSAYVFEKNVGIWSQSGKLVPSDGLGFENNGWAVSISGSTALISSYLDSDNGTQSGSAYIFEGPLQCYPPVVSTAVVDESCLGSSGGSITVNIIEGSGPFTYSLDGGVPQAGDVFAGLSEGSYEVSVILDGDTSCTSSVNALVSFSLEAPVDLNKSLDPVPFPNGVVDRAQIKWYKDSPEVMFAPEDSVACDIQFWPIKDLATNTPIIDGDTSLISQRTKPGQFFFKWPLKFQRPDIIPNTGYRWRVRCACNEGEGPMSPWSEIKFLNIPDFDPLTNIYTPPGTVDPDLIVKSSVWDDVDWQVYPNPAEDILYILSDEPMNNLEILDMTSRSIWAGSSDEVEHGIDISSFPAGTYMIRSRELRTQKLFMVR